MALIFRRRKRPVGTSWRMDATYIKVSGQWKYLYRAVDKSGDSVDFLLTAKRDLAAARRYLERAINLHGLPKKITIDKSGVVLFVNHEANQTDLMKWADAAMYQAKDVGRNGVQFYCSPERNR
jgi:transposase-like protein